jgi:AAA15 family ATPase/GTPase
MAGEKHLKYFEVYNFKRFQNLKLENIGQFNLIVGDNNVGKTSLLEALLFNEDLPSFVRSLMILLEEKKIFNPEGLKSDLLDYKDYIFLYFNNLSKLREIKFLFTKSENKRENFSLEMGRGLEKSFDKEVLLEKKKSWWSNLEEGIGLRYNDKITDVFPLYNTRRYLEIRGEGRSPEKNFISFTKGYDIDLVNLYSEYIQISKSNKESFFRSLQFFIPDLESIEVTTRFASGPHLQVVEKSSNTPLPISVYGDGANKLFRILLQIAACKGDLLMIDEIDTGVHFSRFKDFWRIVLKAAREFDVQLFATTHNPDCLIYYKEALEEEEMESFRNEARLFTIKELPDKSIKSYPFTFDEFEFSIDQGIEIRGGKIQ